MNWRIKEYIEMLIRGVAFTLYFWALAIAIARVL